MPPPLNAPSTSDSTLIQRAYANADVVQLVKGTGNAPKEPGRLRDRFQEVFAKEVRRVRERHGDNVANCEFVRFLDWAAPRRRWRAWGSSK